MRKLNGLVAFVSSTALVVNVFASQRRRAAQVTSSEATSLNEKIRRFAPTPLTANTAQLSPGDRKALQKIIAAAKYYDALYLRQIWSGNEALLKNLAAGKSL